MRPNTTAIPALFAIVCINVVQVPMQAATTLKQVSSLSNRCESGKQNACDELAKVATGDPDIAVRRAAVSGLQDQALLRKLAVQDSDEGVRKAAKERLTPESLAQITAEAAAARRAAVDTTADPAALAKIAAEDPDAGVRSAAVEKLADPAALAKLASSPGDGKVRAVAIEKLNDAPLLGKVALEDKDAAIRNEAVSRLAVVLKNHPEYAVSQDDKGLTPLHWAAVNGDKGLAGVLLANGAAVNAAAKDGGTPLHLAALNDRRDLAQLLLANHADVNAKTGEGETPLHLAIAKGHGEMASLLLPSKADVNAKDNEGRTPAVLTLYAQRYVMGDGELLNLLVNAGANVDTLVLKSPQLIDWKSLGMSLSTQAEIDKLGEPMRNPVTGEPMGPQFMMSGYLGSGDTPITNPMFVAEEALNPQGKPIGTS